MTCKDETTPNQAIQNLVDAKAQVTVFAQLRVPVYTAMRIAVSRRVGNAVQEELTCLP